MFSPNFPSLPSLRRPYYSTQPSALSLSSHKLFPPMGGNRLAEKEEEEEEEEKEVVHGGCNFSSPLFLSRISASKKKRSGEEKRKQESWRSRSFLFLYNGGEKDAEEVGKGGTQTIVKRFRGGRRRREGGRTNGRPESNVWHTSLPCCSLSVPVEIPAAKKRDLLLFFFRTTVWP